MPIPSPAFRHRLLHGILYGLLASAATAHGAAPSPALAFSVPSPGVTPAPDAVLVSRRLRARQGSPRSSDGRTNFIGWYPSSGYWVSATCPSEDYFAADLTYGVCCHRSNPYCDLATACGGPDNNSAIGPDGVADCGPMNTCDTVTVIQTRGSSDARRIIFCIAVSEQYVLPMTWYRMTHPLPEATVTVTLSETVTATPSTEGNHTSQSAGTPPRTPHITRVITASALVSFLALMIP
ncbi:hypothetical protein CPLU01_13531 [Colletotrichum plurivorum]|uniref:Uncharacterized protein n=1 Tax=Colletotrichum plurivorum TaxID=2175906 RepID=A0A8H6JRH4_9PEZI|nr:hypothetical protein CPLU01_13531 [Colletotrichum plurivorum]